MRKLFSKITFWKAVAALILAAGAYSFYVRCTRGLGGSTHLSDQFPWGLWIGFDVLCGVGLAAGGFALCATVHIFNVKRFEPILRPTILTAFLGYLLVIVGLLIDLGRTFQIWHAIIMWNPHSVMFEVAWCVMLYTTVLSLEFAPVVLERLKLVRTLKILKKLSIPIVILGVLLSTLHQSSLGSLYLIVPYKLYALWYSPYLPLFFFISALAVGCAMVIFESFLSSRAFRKSLEMGILSQVGRIAVVVLAVYLTMRFMDIYNRHILSLLFVPRTETLMYWAEMIVGVIAPLILLSFPAARRSRTGLFLGSVMIILGFVMDRLNITITGMEASAGTHYAPSWMEVSITMAIVTAGFIAFGLAAKYLPLFEHEPVVQPATLPKQLPEAWIEDLTLVSEQYQA
ncbi:MAG TPA: Ni/Fe-hydrogenase cytochrome b subunit [Acidobacteriota bacterium]|nr:Ni/Fe-hydrogenase cytochrome b subunit [Acidobacteriota bacterium]